MCTTVSAVIDIYTQDRLEWLMIGSRQELTSSLRSHVHYGIWLVQKIQRGCMNISPQAYSPPHKSAFYTRLRLPKEGEG
jgi:hypothetical protein